MKSQGSPRDCALKVDILKHHTCSMNDYHYMLLPVLNGIQFNSKLYCSSFGVAALPKRKTENLNWQACPQVLPARGIHSIL